MKPNKTVENANSVIDFLNTVDNPSRKEDALAFLALFNGITGIQPKMWGDAIVGYGSYHYKYESGREGDSSVIGFSPRKQNITIYLPAGFENYTELLNRLGKHKIGKSCLYINKLEDIDQKVLAELITQSYRDFTASHASH